MTPDERQFAAGRLLELAGQIRDQLGLLDSHVTERVLFLHAAESVAVLAEVLAEVVEDQDGSSVQVATEIGLNTLPPGSVVLTPTGEAWTRLPDAGDEWPGWQHLACGPINPKTLAMYGPLTVVWQPS